MLLVVFWRDERIEFRWIAQFDLEEPAAGVRFLVDQRRVIHDGFVGFDDFAADG